SVASSTWRTRMPSHWVAKCSFGYDTLLPRDRIMINPCFRHNTTAFDAQDFAEDFAAAMATSSAVTGPINVKMYDLQGPKPVFPAGDATLNSASAAQAYPKPREVAL